MKRLVVILVVLTLAVIAALVAKVDPGYVMMAYGKWSLETSAILLGLIIIIAFTSVYYLIRFLSSIGNIPRRTHDWRESRRHKKANKELSTGLVEIAEGRFDDAQKTLTKHPKDSSLTPTINYLSAARAAQVSGAYQKRDDYFALAYKYSPDDKLAIDMTKAELYLEEGQLQPALTLLESLRQSAPKNKQALRLLAGLYSELDEIQKLKILLPELRKQKVLNPEALAKLTEHCYSRLLTVAATDDKLVTVMNAWADVPKEMKHNRQLLLTYARTLAEKNAGESVEPLLKTAINDSWDTDMVALYGVVNSGNAQRQLKTAESWLAGHEKDPVLMLTLGRLCLRNQLWGKARDYLEVSVHNQGPAEAWYILACLLEKLGEKDKALELFQSGLANAVDVSDVDLPKLTEGEEATTQQRLKIIS